MLVNFAALGNSRIKLRPVPDLASTEILRNFADALFHVVLTETNRPLGSNSPYGHMKMRVFRVVVSYRDPFDWCAEVLFHAQYQVPT